MFTNSSINNLTNFTDEQQHQQQQKEVCIVGLGFKIPYDLNKCLSDPNELWNSLLKGFSSVSETNERWSNNYGILGDIVCNYASLLPLSEIKSFDPLFFGINPSEVDTIDPSQRLLLKCVWNALEDSSYDPITLRGSNTSVFLGASSFDYCNLNKNPNETQSNMFGSTMHSLSNRISYCYDLRGESITIDTACSSSLNAVNLGYNSILLGNSSLSICGGVNLILDPHNSKSFTQHGILSPSGKCNSFSIEADGFVRSEFAGVVILKSLSDAIKDGNRIYCVINGASSSVDGNSEDKSNFYSPSKFSQSDNIKSAIKSCNGKIKASDIDYFEAHGTGTPTGDPIELEGISIALELQKNDNKDRESERKELLIGSFKSNIGHCEASSGVASLIKCCVSMINRQFPPNINFKTPNPSIKFKEWNLKVVTESIPFPNDRNTVMAINNFGVTGSNCCLILSEYKINSNTYNNNNYNNNKFIIPFSSNSKQSLDKYKSLIKNHISSNSNNSFKEFVFKQINSKCSTLVQRSAVIASNWDEFNNEVNEIKSNKNSNIISNIISTSSNNNEKPVTVFVFCGQGSQYNKMAISLYENDSIFRESVDKFDKELYKYYGYSVIEKLRSIRDDDLISIHEPILAQPANVIIQISLFELYTKLWNINADIIVGHSLGEISSAYCSGMINFETLCYLLYHRSLAQNKTTGSGRMLSINISVEQFNQMYSSKYPNIEIACYNSPTSIVITGKEDQLNEISIDLKSNHGIFNSMLGSLSSFHSSSQSIIEKDILKLNFHSTPSTTPVFSTVTTQLFSHEITPYNSNYIFDNILKPVDFSGTISNIYKYIENNDLGNQVNFIEIAPHPTLQFYLNQMKPQQSNYFSDSNKISIYSALHKKKNDHIEVLKCISSLYVNHNYNTINFKSQLQFIDINNSSSNNCINLPSYQWDNKEYFKIHSSFEKILKEGPSINLLGNSNSLPLQSYQSIIDIKKSPFKWLKGHQAKDKCIFPGMGYINCILSAFPNEDISISNFEFNTPFYLTEGINQYLQTTIIPLSKNEYNVKFHFKDLKTNDWILCATGNFNLFKNPTSTTPTNIDIVKLRNQSNYYTKISQDELYNTIKIKCALNYDGLFKSVQECSYGNNCSFSVVSLSKFKEHFNQDNTNNNKLLHTALLDSTLHGLLQIKDQCQILFESIEGFKVYSKNIINIKQSDQLYVYSEMAISSLSTIFSGSVKIMLQDGTLLIEIDKVSCVSTTQIKNNSMIAPSSNEIYTPYYQSKESIINNPSTLQQLYNNERFKIKELHQKELVYSTIYHIFYVSFNERNPTLTRELLNNLNIEEFKQLVSKESSSYGINWDIHIQFVFKCLKKSCEITDKSIEEINQFINSGNFKYYEIINKSTRILSKQLFPIDSQIIDESLFDDGLLDNFYNNYELLLPNSLLLSEIVLESAKSFIEKPYVFRILEIGSGVGSLSTIILEKLNHLLKNHHQYYQIEIEFTFTDISTTFFSNAKEKFKNIIQDDNISIIYRLLDLEVSFTDQQELNAIYYDIVVMSNVLHVVKDVKFSLNQIHSILKPNGQLLYIEPPYSSLITETIFSVFPQWYSFTDYDIRNDKCTLSRSQWYKVLNNLNFKDTIISSDENENATILIQTRKQSLNEIFNSSSNYSLNNINSFNQIILYSESDKDNSKNNLIIKSILSTSKLSPTIKIINNFNELINHIQSSVSTSTFTTRGSNNLLLFLKSMNQLNQDNFKEITFEYIQINQLLLKNDIGGNFKHVLVTMNSQSSNYLSNSLIGTARYFNEEFNKKLNLLSIDISNFDSSTSTNNFSLEILDCLLNSKEYIEKEYFISNNINSSGIFIEKFKKENQIKNKFKSKTFQDDKNELMVQLDSNLEYKLKSKKEELNANQVEVKVIATGINYKDYLVYTGLVAPPELNNANKDSDSNFPNIGNDFSGIVSRVGSNIRKFKIGDQVCGIATKTTSSHFITTPDFICIKPSNISHIQAASLPSIYVTCLHSIYYIGNLKSNETILIHSATGGVGLSALELLKSKHHEGFIFVTVGSYEKVKYLKNVYGSFITDIYSTRDKNYPNQIQNKLKELGCKNHGVDLILNTLSSEYMDSNFKCLNQSGRVVDLSITHLNPYTYTDYNKFKFNYGYHNVDISLFTGKQFKNYFKKILKSISTGKLKYTPIIEFSNSEIKSAIEHINKRIHIGKIVVNHNQDIIDQLYQENKSQISSIILKDKYNISNLNLGKNILLTGQTGIILIILKWLLQYSNGSISNIIILSKSSLKWELELIINENKNNIQHQVNPIQINFKQVDLSNDNELELCLNQLSNDNESESSINNINSIIHFAFLNDIGSVESIDMNRINNAYGAKSIGAINLHNQSIKRNWDIKQFIMASSTASVLGIEKQCCYIGACSVIDSLSKYRKSIGLPSLSINIGLVTSTGFVVRNEAVNIFLENSNLIPISPESIISTLDLFIQNSNQYSNYCHCNFNLKNLSINLLNNSNIFKLDYEVNKSKSPNNNRKDITNNNNNSYNNIHNSIISKISELTSIEENNINVSVKLNHYGVDSLVIVQLNNWIRNEFGFSLISIQQLQNNTISKIIEIISNQLNNNSSNNNISGIDSKKERFEDFIKNEITINDESMITPRPLDIDKLLNNQNKSIFLTGATGFLGSYLLSNLLKRNDIKSIYCLTRNKSNLKNPLDEIFNNLKHHLLYNQLSKELLSKVKVINGLLSKENLGLSNEDYNLLSTECDIIINSAADLNLVQSYSENKVVNVNGVKELIKLSVSNIQSQKLIVHFSSFSVFLNQKLNGLEFEELFIYPNFYNTEFGYIQSKVVSELLLKHYSETKSIPSITIRLPEIFPNPQTGKGHPNDFIQNLLQSSSAIGYYPNLFKTLFCSPVTTLSDYIIKIIFNTNSWRLLKYGNNNSIINKYYSIYNLYGGYTSTQFIFNVLHDNFNCKELDYDSWRSLVQKSNHESCIKFSTLHNFKDHFIIKKIFLDQGFKLSKSTKALLQLIDPSFNEQDLNIDDKMIINHINYILNK